MKDRKPDRDWHGLDLTAVRRILQQAGRPDPTKNGSNPTAQLQALIDALCNLSLHDGLTGLVNAMFFQAVLASELERCMRTGRACGLLLMDIDHFKDFNDTHGHPTADLVLQRVASYLKRSIRSMDTAARIGGEEFAIILPECEPMSALCAAIRIHGLLNPLMVEVGRRHLSINVSAGLAWTGHPEILSVEELLDHADQQLYRAKRSGRSRLCHPPVTETLVSPEERNALALFGRKEDSDGR